MDSKQKSILEHMLKEISFIENETAGVSFDLIRLTRAKSISY
jgi:hypothetical protein